MWQRGESGGREVEERIYFSRVADGKVEMKMLPSLFGDLTRSNSMASAQEKSRTIALKGFAVSGNGKNK